MIDPPITHYEYQVGGSLKNDAPSYVVRLADKQLYEALLAGEFCYVLNSRQMGKSSLRVRVKNQLQDVGYRCASLDFTSIGSETMTPIQWYKGVIWELCRGFNLLNQVDFKAWWQDQQEFSPVKRLDRFINEILLELISSQPIVIFIDEIDSVLGLPFAVNDFWGLIRFYYNKRAENSIYNRLSFALFGVATPSDLISPQYSTPFNIGTAIELKGFQSHEIQPLMTGLKEVFSYPQGILEEILYWTGGQPFLTQKLCQIVIKQLPPSLAPESVSDWVERLVRSQIILDWETKDEPEHLRTIRNRLLRNEQQIGRLLGCYQEILQQRQIAFDESSEQRELLLSGLIIKRGSHLRVRNLIYEQVFDRYWVNQQLDRIRPYGNLLSAWVNSHYQDESKLLRGQDLLNAKKWSKNRRLSDLDYQFLAASETLDRQETQQELEAERLKETEARLKAEKKSSRQKKRLIGVISIAFLVSCGLIVLSALQHRLAVLSEIRAIARSSQGQLNADQGLDALLEAIRAKRKLQALKRQDKATESEVNTALGKAVYGALELNRFVGHQDGVWDVDFSQDGETLITASWDNTIKLWQRNGRLIKTLTGHKNRVFTAKFIHNDQLIASGSMDKTIKIWTPQGELLRTLETQAPVYDVIFSQNDQTIIATVGNTIQIWSVDGKLLNTLRGHTADIYDVELNHQGDIIASGSQDDTIKLWRNDGTLLKTLDNHNNAVWDIEWSPDDTYFLSGSEDGTIKKWLADGTFVKTLITHQSAVMDIEFGAEGKSILSTGEDQIIKASSLEGNLIYHVYGHQDGILDLAIDPQKKTVASASWDTTVKLWQPNKSLLVDILQHQAEIRGIAFNQEGNQIVTASRDHTLKIWTSQEKSAITLKNHLNGVSAVAYSSDDTFFASGSRDETVKLWLPNGENFSTLTGHTDWVLTVAISPDSQLIASGGLDKTINLWNREGKLLKTLDAHSGGVLDLTFSPDGQYIISGGGDNTVKIWQLDGTLVRTFKGHTASVRSVAVSPDGSKIVSGSRDITVKLWNWQGKLLNTLEGHHARVWAVKFSQDGQIIASGSDDGTVKFWDLDGNLRKILYGYQSMIRSLAFSPDNKQIAVGSRENLLILWDLQAILSVNELEYACNWIKDYLKWSAEVSDSDRTLCDDVNK